MSSLTMQTMGPLDDSAASGKASAGIPGREARISLILLLSINLFNYIDRNVLAAVEAKVQKSLFPNSGMEDPHALYLMGWLPTAFLVSYMIAAPIFGWLADRMSRWILIGISVILWSVATGASGLAATFMMLLFTRLFVGIGEAGYGPAAPTIISDLYPIQRRGTVLAWFYMAIPVGSALGFAIGDLVSSRWGWRAAFFCVTPAGLLLGLFCFLRKDPARGAADPAALHTRKPNAGDYLSLLRTPSYLLDTAGMTLMSFAIGGIQYWMPHYLSEVRQVGPWGGTIFGLLTAAGGIAGTLLGGLAGDALRPRFSGSYFLVSGGGILLSCPFILLLPFVSFPTAWVMIFFAVFWLFFNTGPSNTILANVTHPSIRATAFALNILIIHALGDASASPILAKIAGSHGWNMVFVVTAAVTAAGGVFWLIGAWFLAEDTEKAPGRLN